jgi:hypothetical protein
MNIFHFYWTVWFVRESDKPVHTETLSNGDVVVYFNDVQATYDALDDKVDLGYSRGIVKSLGYKIYEVTYHRNHEQTPQECRSCCVSQSSI